MSQGQTPDDIEDAMAKFVGRSDPLPWEATMSLRTLKLQAKETIDKYANVLARKSMFTTEEVEQAEADIIAKEKVLTEARTHWAIRTLNYVESAEPAELRFDSSPMLPVNKDRQKFLITHFSENQGFQVRPVHMEWFPAQPFIHGLDINTRNEMYSLVSQLRDRYASHEHALRHDRGMRVQRKYGDNVDHQRVNRKHELDPAVKAIQTVVKELGEALKHMNDEHASTFSGTPKPVSRAIRRMGDKYIRNPVDEDITYDPTNRYIFEFFNQESKAVVKVQSTTLRRHKPHIPFTENENTTEFLNTKILPHTLRWVLVTISTPERSFAVKIMPFHGKSTSMVFPVIAKVKDGNEGTEDMTNFNTFDYDVFPLEPYVIQGKPKEVDIMRMAVNVSKMVGDSRDEVKYDLLPMSLVTALDNSGAIPVFPRARVYYSVEDTRRGDTSVYMLMVRNQILMVQVYSPFIGGVLWKLSQAVGRGPPPGPWVIPPMMPGMMPHPGMMPGGAGGNGPAKPPRNGSKPHVFSNAYLEAHKDYRRHTIPNSITIVEEGGSEELKFSVTDLGWLIYTKKDEGITIRPFLVSEEAGYSWGMYGPDETDSGNIILKWHLTEPSPDLIDVNPIRGWTLRVKDRDGNFTWKEQNLIVDASGYPVTRKYNGPYPASDESKGPYYNAVPAKTKDEMPSYLPLQPRRLAARPGPAPWRDAGQPSVEMAGVLASLAEIKRALNEARALAPASR